MQAPSPRKALPLHALIGVVFIGSVVLITPRTSFGQDEAWSLYEDAVDAAERGEYDEALVLYRQAERVVTDDVLSRAVCYGSGLVARKLIERDSVERRSLACQGVEWFDCYLDGGEFEDKEVERIATRARDQLQVICEPQIQNTDFNPWPWSGLAAGTGVLGASLLVVALGDASDIRALKTANDTRGGETPAQAQQLENDEQSARIKYGFGLGLIGVGVGVASWILWHGLSAEEKNQTSQIDVDPMGMRVTW